MTGVDARFRVRLPTLENSPSFELDLQFSAGPGITIILGPSGSGKTLTLNCVAGFVRPDQGRILVNNQIYFDAEADVCLPPERRRCGYIFQDHALFPHMTVRENLRFAVSLARTKNGSLNSHRRVQEMLQSFELTELAGRKPAQLSGGQKQRAAIARTLVSEPAVLLLDEPARGLDERLRQNFFSLLRELRERLTIPILCVSHDLEDYFSLADSLLLLENGRVLQAGTREHLLANPASVDVARAIGAFNIVEGEIRSLDPAANSSRIRILKQEIEGPYLPGRLIGDRGFVCLRRAEMNPANQGASDAENRLRLQILQLVPLPLGVRLTLEHDFQIMVRQSETGASKGDVLTLEFPKSAVSFVSQ